MKLQLNKMLWLGVLVACGAGWVGWRAYQTHQIETDKDRAIAMSEEMFKPEKPQRVCFGRMVFEPPKGAQMQGSIYQYPGAQKIEETLNVTQSDFNQTVEEFEQRLRDTKHDKDPSLLKSVHAIPGANNAKLFVHWGYTFEAPLMSITGYWWADGIQYRFASEADLEAVASGTDTMAKLLADVRPLAANEVPAEHGFCLNNAFIPDTLTGKWHERAEMAFAVKPWEDVWISIETETRHVPDQTLIERIDTAPQRMPGSTRGMTTIRRGERTVNGLKGQEVLTQFKGEGKSFYLFFWEIAGALNSNDPPIINLDLKIGQQTGHSELTQDQALALWEYLLVHLKPRPTTAVTKTSDATVPPRTPLGELAATGRICPQTGWWECAEASAPVRGSRRQFFRAGDPMPAAVLLGRPGLLQRMKGDAPTHRIATVWTLVDYEAPAARPASIAARGSAHDPTKGDSSQATGAATPTPASQRDETPPTHEA